MTLGARGRQSGQETRRDEKETRAFRKIRAQNPLRKRNFFTLPDHR
jgi:hypothetical protein